MTLDRLFKLSVVFLATVVAVMLLLSIVATVLATAGGSSETSVVHAKRVPAPAHRFADRHR